MKYIVRLLSAIAVAGSVASTAQAVTIVEDFSSASLGGSPFARGWSAVGDTNLFVWNSANGNLEVTWDSRKPNSFFQIPLGITLNKTNDFSVAFDLKLLSTAQHPEKPAAMQLAIGFINLAQATNTNYRRATGFESPNLVEFTYFPDPVFGETFSPVALSTNHHFAADFANYLFEFQLGQTYRVEMNYVAANERVTAIAKQGGTNLFQASFTLKSFDTNFSDFGVNTFSISSYNDAGQLPEYAGSILANGVIDNVTVVTPAPPVGRVSFSKSSNTGRAEVYCQPGESYILQRTSNFEDWDNVDTEVAISPVVILEDTPAPVGSYFYRVKQNLP